MLRNSFDGLKLGAWALPEQWWAPDAYSLVMNAQPMGFFPEFLFYDYLIFSQES